MMTGTPIIAPMTGGQTRQVIDYRNNTQNGVALPIEFQTMVGNQTVPYILEDYTSTDTIAEAILDMYHIKKLPIGYRKLCDRVKEYAHYEFNYEDRIGQWDNLLEHTIQTWKTRYNRYSMEAVSYTHLTLPTKRIV